MKGIKLGITCVTMYGAWRFTRRINARIDRMTAPRPPRIQITAAPDNAAVDAIAERLTKAFIRFTEPLMKQENPAS